MTLANTALLGLFGFARARLRKSMIDTARSAQGASGEQHLNRIVT